MLVGLLSCMRWKFNYILEKILEEPFGLVKETDLLPILWGQICFLMFQEKLHGIIINTQPILKIWNIAYVLHTTLKCFNDICLAFFCCIFDNIKY